MELKQVLRVIVEKLLTKRIDIDPKNSTPFYELFSERLNSFADLSGAIDPIELTFKCYTNEDVCVGFECGVEIHKWYKGDSPLNDHLSIHVIVFIQNG